MSAEVYGPVATQPHLFNPQRHSLPEDRAWESAPTVRTLPFAQQNLPQASRTKAAAPMPSCEPPHNSRKSSTSISAAFPTLLSPRWSSQAGKPESRALLRAQFPQVDQDSQLTEEGLGDPASSVGWRVLYCAACVVLCAGLILTGVTLMPRREQETDSSWLVQNLPFLHAAGASVGCYGEFPGLVDDEGAGIHTLTTHSLESCKASCDDYAQCHSVTFCPSLSAGCWLKARALDGSEPMHVKGDCKTFYKKPCSSAR
eukprot:TRINITY_DN111024_c0_g1_i1.p1 TRINITY_DN111024_c0_g1~~TRINITY_DN111024_c0_g1_i1.p1  ORF type:complete len:257 (-),score=39.84 TRINITY_DN111024_c0_g1_i1:58-828(-)